MVDNDKIGEKMSTWFTLQENIDKTHKHYKSLVSFKATGNLKLPFYNSLSHYPNIQEYLDTQKKDVRRFITSLLRNDGHYNYLDSDIIRKPTMEEYLIITQTIRKGNIKLNKKTSEIIYEKI
jgi:hypothetical protein